MKKFLIVLLLVLAAAAGVAWKFGYLAKIGIGRKPSSETVAQKPKSAPQTKPSSVVTPTPPDTGLTPSPGRTGTDSTATVAPPVRPAAPAPPPALTAADRLKAAEADLVASKTGIERAKADAMARLVKTPTYATAKAEADKTETAVKAVRARSDGPSAELTTASQRWIGAKGRLARLARETRDKDPVILASIKAVKDKTVALEALRGKLAAEERTAVASAAPSTPSAAQVAPQPKPETARPPVARPPAASGATGEGFAYRNLSLRTGLFSEDVVGEITNNTGREYAVACFVVSLLDPSGKVIETAPVNVETFRAGETRNFTASTQADASKVARFQVKLQTGF